MELQQVKTEWGVSRGEKREREKESSGLME
jgi:hypothetical protein